MQSPRLLTAAIISSLSFVFTAHSVADTNETPASKTHKTGWHTKKANVVHKEFGRDDKIKPGFPQIDFAMVKEEVVALKTQLANAQPLHVYKKGYAMVGLSDYCPHGTGGAAYQLSFKLPNFQSDKEAIEFVENLVGKILNDNNNNDNNNNNNNTTNDDDDSTIPQLRLLGFFKNRTKMAATTINLYWRNERYTYVPSFHRRYGNYIVPNYEDYNSRVFIFSDNNSSVQNIINEVSNTVAGVANRLVYQIKRYSPLIKHRAGKDMFLSDPLSRYPLFNLVDVSQLEKNQQSYGYFGISSAVSAGLNEKDDEKLEIINDKINVGNVVLNGNVIVPPHILENSKWSCLKSNFSLLRSIMLLIVFCLIIWR